MKKAMFLVLAMALMSLALMACTSNGVPVTSAEESKAASATESVQEQVFAVISERPSQEATTGAKKIGIFAPAVTHGWVAATAYYAQGRCKELGD